MNQISLLTSAHIAQFKNEGYFIIENALPGEHLELLRGNCNYFIERTNAEMDEKGVDSIGISHRNKRYFASHCVRDRPGLGRFVFGDFMAEICRATLGGNAYLFWDQYVVKCADKETTFSWHQDSGYVHMDCPPYLTCWVPLDDVTEANGTVYLLPYSVSGIRSVVKHIPDPKSNDLVGYFGKERGVPVIVPAGSIACFSSYVFHSSGANTTDRMRRVYLPQYSSDIIRHSEGKPFGQSIPFLKDGQNVASGACGEATV